MPVVSVWHDRLVVRQAPTGPVAAARSILVGISLPLLWPGQEAGRMASWGTRRRSQAEQHPLLAAVLYQLLKVADQLFSPADHPRDLIAFEVGLESLSDLVVADGL